MSVGVPVGELFKQVANQILGRLSYVDIDTLERADQRFVSDIKRLVSDTRLDIRDYEYADTRDELKVHATNAVERLNRLRAAILQASESGIFGAADVAQLSAQLDLAVGKLR